MPRVSYLFNQITHKRYRLNGIKISNRLPHKEFLKHLFADHVQFNDDELPPKVDLRPEMTPVEDQSTVGSW